MVWQVGLFCLVNSASENVHAFVWPWLFSFCELMFWEVYIVCVTFVNNSARPIMRTLQHCVFRFFIWVWGFLEVPVWFVHVQEIDPGLIIWIHFCMGSHADYVCHRHRLRCVFDMDYLYHTVLVCFFKTRVDVGMLYMKGTIKYRCSRWYVCQFAHWKVHCCVYLYTVRFEKIVVHNLSKHTCVWGVEQAAHVFCGYLYTVTEGRWEV